MREFGWARVSYFIGLNFSEPLLGTELWGGDCEFGERVSKTGRN